MIGTNSKYQPTKTQRLGSITEHPKIAVSAEEYRRIKASLKYYRSEFDDVNYLDSNGDWSKRPFNHLPIGRTAAKKLASLVYNEKATVSLADKKANDFIQEVLGDDRFHKNFERYLESGLALGGLAMRPYVDGDKIRVAFVQAPVFFPLQSNTQDVSEAAIVTRTTKANGQRNTYYTLIEFHEWKQTEAGESLYVITNELYTSQSADAVGERVALSELYPDLDEVVEVENLTRPLFTYLKTPGMNNRDINSPLGLSIFDNAKSTIDFINTTYDEYQWEVKMGQRRVIVPENMTRTQIVPDNNGNLTTRQRFDPGQNVFVPIGIGGLDGQHITDVTTPIRASEYIATINQGLKIFEMLLGVSSGMFTFDGEAVKTATEVVSENSDTYQTRQSIATLVEQAHKELVVSIFELAVGYDLYSGPIPTVDDVTVDLDDGVFQDRQSEFIYWAGLYAAGGCSQLTFIMKTRGLTRDQAVQELKEINGELPLMTDAEFAIYNSQGQKKDENDNEEAPDEAVDE